MHTIGRALRDKAVRKKPRSEAKKAKRTGIIIDDLEIKKSKGRNSHISTPQLYHIADFAQSRRGIR
jgi:hypothetical protein